MPETRVRGLVRVDLSYTARSGRRRHATPRFDAQARFVRYRSFDAASVPTILGFADFDERAARRLQGVRRHRRARLGARRRYRGADGGGGAARRRQPRAARSAQIAPRIMPRHYPELVPFVSGVVYGGDELTPVALGLGQPYSGGRRRRQRGRPVHRRRSSAPRSFPSLTVDPLHRGSDLDVRWATESAAGAEPLVLEARWSSRGGTHTVRCRVRDDGAFAIPHDAFADLPATTALSIGDGDGDAPLARALLRARRRSRRADARAQGRGRAAGRSMSGAR